MPIKTYLGKPLRGSASVSEGLNIQEIILLHAWSRHCVPCVECITPLSLFNQERGPFIISFGIFTHFEGKEWD